jgi:hypothetical protein
MNWPSVSPEAKVEPKLPNFALSSSPVNLRFEKSESQGESPTESKREIEEIEEKEPTEDVPEPVPNSDERTSVAVHFCGHCMHDDCFSGFFTSLLQRHLQSLMNQRTSPTNVEKGEFFCPVCRFHSSKRVEVRLTLLKNRRLSNAIIPEVSDEALQQVKQQMDKIKLIYFPDNRNCQNRGCGRFCYVGQQSFAKCTGFI